MASAALDEQCDHVRIVALDTARGIEERRPADHVELVHVANAVHVAARIEQGAHDLEVATGGSPMQRVSVVPVFTGIRIRAVLRAATVRRPGVRAELRSAIPSSP